MLTVHCTALYIPKLRVAFWRTPSNQTPFRRSDTVFRAPRYDLALVARRSSAARTSPTHRAVEDDDLGADGHAAVQIHHVLVAHPNAPRGDELSDCGRFVRAVDPVKRIAEIERACAEWIVQSAGHELRQARAAFEHFPWGSPIGPLGHPGHALATGPGGALPADADTVAKSLPVAEYQVKISIGGIYNNGSGRFAGGIENDAALQIVREPRTHVGLVEVAARARPTGNVFDPNEIAIRKPPQSRRPCFWRPTPSTARTACPIAHDRFVRTHRPQEQAQALPPFRSLS